MLTNIFNNWADMYISYDTLHRAVRLFKVIVCIAIIHTQVQAGGEISS